MSEPETFDRRYRKRDGITVHRRDRETAVGPAAAALVERLDRQPAVFMSSCFEFPGRYTRWDLGFAAQPHQCAAYRLPPNAPTKSLRLSVPAMPSCDAPTKMPSTAPSSPPTLEPLAKL